MDANFHTLKAGMRSRKPTGSSASMPGPRDPGFALCAHVREPRCIPCRLHRESVHHRSGRWNDDCTGGHGSGEGRAASPGEAHDTALKAAETDATKRRPFGLELYRKDKNAALASLSTLRSTAVESPPTQPRYGELAQLRERSPLVALIQTYSGRIRQEPGNALWQLLLWPLPQLNSLRPGSTRASSHCRTQTAGRQGPPEFVTHNLVSSAAGNPPIRITCGLPNPEPLASR